MGSGVGYTQKLPVEVIDARQRIKKPLGRIFQVAFFIAYLELF